MPCCRITAPISAGSSSAPSSQFRWAKPLPAGRLEVEGLATLNILYISAGGEPARGEYKVPFTRMLELHGEAEDPIITVGMLPGPVSCRAVNQRRLEIRGSVVVSASVISCHGQQILAGSEEKTIQLRMAQQKGIRLSGAFDREQRLAKTTTLEGSAAPLTRVLRCDAAVSRREEKWLDGRLLITGEVLAAAHCADQNGGWQTAECTLPFELTIDCPEGADAEFDIRCRALAPTAEPMQDADGEYRALEWGVTISVDGKIYRAYALDCCTDGYSTRYQSACKGRTLQTVELVNLCRESETRRETLPLPEATGEVVALWARVEGCTAAPEGDGLLAEGRLGLTLLTKMGDGEYYSFDRTMELQRQLPGGEDCRWEAGLECRGCRWEQTGNELSLTCELVWAGGPSAAPGGWPSWRTLRWTKRPPRKTGCREGFISTWRKRAKACGRWPAATIPARRGSGRTTAKWANAARPVPC